MIVPRRFYISRDLKSLVCVGSSLEFYGTLRCKVFVEKFCFLQKSYKKNLLKSSRGTEGIVMLIENNSNVPISFWHCKSASFSLMTTKYIFCI